MFADLPDPRVRPVDHDLTEMLVVALYAILCGADSWVAVALWGQEKQAWRRRFLSRSHPRPICFDLMRLPWGSAMTEFHLRFFLYRQARQKITIYHLRKTLALAKERQGGRVVRAILPWTTRIEINMRNTVMNKRIILQAVMILLISLWAQVSMANTDCTVTGPTTVTVPPGLAIRSTDPAGTLVWQSEPITTQFNCPNMSEQVHSILACRYAGQSVPAEQIGLSVVWSAGKTVNATLRTTTGTVASNTSFSATDIGRTATVGPTGYSVDATWYVRLTKGSATTSAGLASLPANGLVEGIAITGACNSTPSNAVRTFINGLNTIRVVTNTCTVTVANGNVVTLPTASASQLAVAGQTMGNKPFTIRLSSCATNGTATSGLNVRTYFNGGSVDPTTGRLNTDRGSAQNIQLQVLNAADTSVINLAGGYGAQGVNITQINAGSANLHYIARYYATGRSIPGPVSTRVNYTIEYP